MGDISNSRPEAPGLTLCTSKAAQAWVTAAWPGEALPPPRLAPEDTLEAAVGAGVSLRGWGLAPGTGSCDGGEARGCRSGQDTCEGHGQLFASRREALRASRLLTPHPLGWGLAQPDMLVAS